MNPIKTSFIIKALSNYPTAHFKPILESDISIPERYQYQIRFNSKESKFGGLEIITEIKNLVQNSFQTYTSNFVSYDPETTFDERLNVVLNRFKTNLFELLCRDVSLIPTNEDLKKLYSVLPNLTEEEKTINIKTTSLMEAIKHDQNKPDWNLIEFEFIGLMVEVMTFGAKKYAPNNWKGLQPERVFSALMRHINASLNEELDKESGVDHLAHAACNLMMLWYLKNNQESDRLSDVNSSNEVDSISKDIESYLNSNQKETLPEVLKNADDNALLHYYFTGHIPKSVKDKFDITEEIRENMKNQPQLIQNMSKIEKETFYFIDFLSVDKTFFLYKLNLLIDLNTKQNKINFFYTESGPNNSIVSLITKEIKTTDLQELTERVLKLMPLVASIYNDKTNNNEINEVADDTASKNKPILKKEIRFYKQNEDGSIYSITYYYKNKKGIHETEFNTLTVLEGFPYETIYCVNDLYDYIYFNEDELDKVRKCIYNKNTTNE